jgi:hypothetical protein
LLSEDRHRRAAGFWGKAGQRSLARSALLEAVEQLTRAIDQIATLPGTPALRCDRIALQVALINALFHVKGYAAPETKAAAEQARMLIEQAKALGEAPEDPLLLFSVLYGFWVANLVAPGLISASVALTTPTATAFSASTILSSAPSRDLTTKTGLSMRSIVPRTRTGGAFLRPRHWGCKYRGKTDRRE